MPPRGKKKRQRNPSSPAFGKVVSKAPKLPKTMATGSNPSPTLPDVPVLFDPAIIEHEVLKALTHPDVRKLLLEIFTSATEKTIERVSKCEAKTDALEEKVNNLCEIVANQADTIKKMSAKDDLEQNGRRNGIRISGIPETETKGNSIPWFKSFAKDHLNLTIGKNAVSRMHRVGNPGTPAAPRTKPREILIKFTSYQCRREVLYQNKYLRAETNPGKLKDVFLNEDLSRQRQGVYFVARQGDKLNKLDGAWTADGTIITKLKEVIKRWTEEAPLTAFLASLPVRAKKSTPPSRPPSS